mgnify:CR=1 FL=1
MVFRHEHFLINMPQKTITCKEKIATNRVNIKKIMSLFVCAYIVFVMVFSLNFIVTHTNHICHGEDCQICFSIHLSQDILNIIGSAFTFIAVISFLIGLFDSILLTNNADNRSFTSLFSLKVKLNS